MDAQQPRAPRRIPVLVQAFLLGAATGALVATVANLLAGRDLSAKAAAILHLGSGVVLAALTGGLLAVWLSRGGHRRIAGFGGLILGILAGWLLWRYGAAYVWVVGVVLKGAFGEGADEFTGLVVFALMYLVIRLVAQATSSILSSRLERPRVL